MEMGGGGVWGVLGRLLLLGGGLQWRAADAAAAAQPLHTAAVSLPHPPRQAGASSSPSQDRNNISFGIDL